jgi:hypothetical protein
MAPPLNGHRVAHAATAPGAALSPAAVEQVVVLARLQLYNRGLPCGAAVLHRYLREQVGLRPVPSIRQIRTLLTQYGLTYGRTGWYEGEDLPAGVPRSAWLPPDQRRYRDGGAPANPR